MDSRALVAPQVGAMDSCTRSVRVVTHFMQFCIWRQVFELVEPEEKIFLEAGPSPTLWTMGPCPASCLMTATQPPSKMRERMRQRCVRCVVLETLHRHSLW